ncbi:MAG: c-type cytochrome domain-containing protein, partial [Bacteroidota bacterium]
MDLIGKFHPLLLHLPIGILVYTFLHWSYELVWPLKKQPTDFTFALSLGTLSAFASAVSGWILAQEGGYDTDLLNWHQYLGIATALAAALLLWLYKKKTNDRNFTLYFTFLMLLLTLTGHFGGSLTHGEGYLSVSKKTPPTLSIDNPQEAHIFNDIVMPIFEEKCVSCHNPQKSKGGLLLHDLAAWQKGGDNGPVLQAGIAAESAIIQRIFLPKEKEEHMPPAGKLQLTNEERSFLEWWVDNMENYDHQIKD